MKVLIIVLLISLAVYAGLVFLQLFLSKRQNKWPGLILPLLFFLASVFVLMGQLAPEEGVTFGFILSIAETFFWANIPTLILLAVYIACREKLRRKKQLEKMDLQDLD